MQNVLMGQMCAGRAPSGVRPAGVVAEGLFFPDGVFSEDVPFIAFDEGIAAIYGDATVDGQALCHHLLCVHVKFFHNGTAICLFHCSFEFLCSTDNSLVLWLRSKGVKECLAVQVPFCVEESP